MAIGNTMAAIEIAKPGGPDVLRLCERPVPSPLANEVLIEVAAAGVNRPDCLQRAGLYPPPPGASDIPGLEAAGTIVAAGDGVDASAIGRKVMALVAGGGYARFCVAPMSNTLPVPDGMGMTEAAAIPETYFTVWHNVFQRGRLRAGETLLVHGGASGIGTTAIQLGVAFGARVLATAGSAAKCAACARLGAEAIDYTKEDFVARTLAETSGHGADVILDMVGGDYIARNYEAAAEDGRIVQIAFLKGTVAQANFARLMVKRLTHTGSTLRIRSVAFKAALADELQAKVWPLLASGRIGPVIDKVYPLGEAAKAHARMESGENIGKIVLAAG
jgi:putative PIG3 family NAD(P)H quinone oxidoreductase